MKKIETKFLKTYNTIIAGLLAVLGFASSCEADDPKAEYGTPSAKFIVNGKIESAESNKAIENIRVVMLGDTVFTNAEGKYQVSDKHGFPIDQTYNIQFQDIDGELHGEFENLDTTVEFKDPQFTNGSGAWYKGETTKEFNVKLQPKK